MSDLVLPSQQMPQGEPAAVVLSSGDDDDDSDCVEIPAPRPGQCTVLYCTGHESLYHVLYCTVLYCIVQATRACIMYCIVLYYTVLYEH